ncbi:MAG: isocitrate/isopropylmalate family dehydrogenase [Eubacterium sp.]|nr:isocitrate/isopropylmalate family dehydrogenase [Eubacterium sp.]
MDRNIEIESALVNIRKLLEEQYDRASGLGKTGKRKFSVNAERITIGLIDGDGIGPVIMTEARRVLEKLLSDELASGNVCLRSIKGLTIENRMKLGESVPSDVMEEIKSCDVLLKGPTTTPKGGKMESANVTLRRELDLFANVRPVKVPDKDIDWIFFRENTEGEYVLGNKGVELSLGDSYMAFDFKVTTVAGTERIAKAAFDYARNNGKSSVAIVTKANIMKKTDGLFSKIAHEVAADYEEIKVEDWYVDIMAANLLNESARKDFQVFLLPNLYGDILTDEAAEIQGGVGTAGSANIGEKYAMFEAVHGSAPRMVEAGLADYANPSSIFKAVSMLLKHIGMSEKALCIEAAMDAIETSGSPKVTGERGGASAKEFTDAVISML